MNLKSKGTAALIIVIFILLPQLPMFDVAIVVSRHIDKTH
jgi:hypothetical protein